MDFPPRGEKEADNSPFVEGGRGDFVFSKNVEYPAVASAVTSAEADLSRKRPVPALCLEFVITETRLSDASLFGTSTADDNVVSALLDGQPIHTADFRWFLNDALVPNQRIAYTHPGAAPPMQRPPADPQAAEAAYIAALRAEMGLKIQGEGR